MNKVQTLQDAFLNGLRKDKIPVLVYLVNGIKLQGSIEAFDQYSILLRDGASQLVYKHAVSTITPVKSVQLQSEKQNNI